ncbi:70-kilodalton heat shock protein [Allomyces arbusculus]|nr:70-kilodalton heat shock protein [Allomyces arbusculus]
MQLPALKLPTIGIDLGTSTARVAIWHDDQVKLITDSQGRSDMPSCVAFMPTRRLFGADATLQAAVNPTNTIRDLPRLLGRRFNDEAVQSDMLHWPFTVKSDGRGSPCVELVDNVHGIKRFAPEQLTAMLLRQLKTKAETHLGTGVTHAVITVPSTFTTAQRQATTNAAVIAGFDSVRLLNAPSAVAMAHCLETKNAMSEGERNVLVVDFGGGSLDVTLTTIEDSVVEVKATSARLDLGGIDFDHRLKTYLVQEIRRRYHKDLSSDPHAMARVRVACERAKCALSSAESAPVVIEALLPGTDFCTTLTRARSEDMCDDLFRAVVEPVEQVLRDARMEPNNVHEILLVGGASRMPKVQQLLADMFGGSSRVTLGSSDAAAQGAAIMGAILSRDPSPAIHDLTLLDVVPHSLSVQVGAGPLISIVPRGTIVPARKDELIPLNTTTSPPEFIHVYENSTHLLGQVDLPALPPETPHIRVTFDLDAAAHLAVAITDDLDQHRITAKITGPNRLLQVDLGRMRLDLDYMCKADQEAVARIDARNRLERYVVTLRGNTARNPTVAARMTGEDVDKLESVVAETLHWLDYAGEDVGQVDFEEVLADVEARANAVVAEYLDVVGGSEGEQ